MPTYAVLVERVLTEQVMIDVVADDESDACDEAYRIANADPDDLNWNFVQEVVDVLHGTKIRS